MTLGREVANYTARQVAIVVAIALLCVIALCTIALVYLNAKMEGRYNEVSTQYAACQSELKLFKDVLTDCHERERQHEEAMAEMRAFIEDSEDGWEYQHDDEEYY